MSLFEKISLEDLYFYFSRKICTEKWKKYMLSNSFFLKSQMFYEKTEG